MKNKALVYLVCFLLVSQLSFAQEKAGFSWLTYTTCTSDSTQFMDTSSTGCGTPISYRWSFGDPSSGAADSSNSQNPKHLFSTTGTFNVQLIVDWACSPVDTVVLPVTIGTGTVPVANMFSVVSLACDSSVLFTAGGTTGSFPRTSFWSFGDGNTSTSTFIPYTYVSSGTYNVYHAVTNACGTDTIYKSVYVPAAPIVGFTKNVSDTFCAGTTVILTDTSSGDNFPLTYNWTMGSQGRAKVQNPTFKFNSGEKTAIVLSVTDSFGCNRTVIDSVLITIDTNLSSFIYAESCPCSDINFTATGTAANWQWEFGDNTTSTSVMPSHSYNKPETYTVSLTGIASNGCLTKTSKVINVCNAEILSPLDKSKSDMNWVFANKKGFDFSSGVPVVTNPLFDGSQETAIAVSSPTSGKLLFYTSVNFVGTNNWRIIDASNNIMQNSDSIAGDHDSPQGGMIIPFPGDSNKYYFIGNSSEMGMNKLKDAITYSVIDMTANGGLGAVTDKNEVLDTSFVRTAECMSGMEAIAPTCNNNGAYWVATFVIENGHGFSLDDNFELHLYSFSYTGIATKIIPLTDYKYDIYAITTTALKFSPDGSKIAIPFQNGAYLYDFDKLNGSISNPRILDLGGVISGMEFSPNSRFLYVCSFGLHQFDLFANDINASKVTLAGTFFHGINIGIDNKLYVENAALSSVSVINNPNILGLGSNFVLNSIPLGAQFGATTLQNIVSLTVPQDTVNAYFSSQVNCSSTSFNNLSFVDTCSYAFEKSSFAWDFGDGITSTNFQPTHNYASAGIYDVQLIVTKNISCIADTFVQTIMIDTFPSFNFSTDTVCFGDTTNMLSGISNVKNPPLQYLWSSTPTELNDTTANVSHVFSIVGSIEVFLMITDTLGCSYSDTNMVLINEAPIVAVNSDTNICEGSNVILNGTVLSGSQPVSYAWFPISALSIDTIPNPTATPTLTTDYLLLSTNECGTDSASTTIIVANCELFIPNAFSPNGDGINDVFQIRGEGFKNFFLAIYDRWGNKVFESKSNGTPSVAEGWDGSGFNKGVYVYRLSVEMLDGKLIEQNGNITLVK